MITGIKVEFKNRPNKDGGVSTFFIENCAIAPNNSPTLKRPQILIHLPKADKTVVDGAWVNYDGHDYHVVGTTPKLMDPNTPTPWNRYCIAEKIY